MTNNTWAPLRKAFGLCRKHYDVLIERAHRKCLLTVFYETRFKHQGLQLLLSLYLTAICKTRTWKKCAQMKVYT